MQLADHLRPLLRDHDCVIIPDFGGLVAEYAPARVQPGGRHVLSPPTRQVAFNQALTRNDGLLLDALREHLNLPAAEAREALRQAVAALHLDLQARQRTELPGVGVFRQVTGRGLQFEYTGTDNMLAAAFGLPELQAHPVRTTDARLAREQQAQLVPRLRSASRSVRLRRLVPGAAIGLLAGLAVAGLYLANLHPALVPVAWRGYVPRWEMSQNPAPQQATLATTGSGPVAATPVLAPASIPATSPTITPEPSANVTIEPAASAEFTAAAKVMEAPATSSSVAPKKTEPLAADKPAAPAAKLVTAKPMAAPGVATKKLAVAKSLAHSAAAGATTIKARTGRYYVIVGAFSTLLAAEKGRLVLAKTGRPAKVILPYWGTRFYRLSAADFADAGSASVMAQRLRHNPNFDKGSSVLAY
ncbi:MAG: hypothetical protein ACRYFX_25215 [Janthinobacterium lividum]